ncbi:MAG: hypothetical protein R2827_16315, partial [Bdellovibrionales bacterium]
MGMEEAKERFWRKHSWLTASGLQLADRTLNSKQIIDTLAPYLTDERKQRISQVLEGRTQKIVPVMENIYDRGNISAAMRSAEAYGFYQ